MIHTALGQEPADLYIQNGRLLNVYSGEILDGWNIAVKGRSIAYVGPSSKMVGPATTVRDAEGAYLVPGYIDPHAHLDFWANPLALTPYLLAGGTTTVMTDPHDIVGATGLPGLELLLAMTRNLPLKFYFSLPVASPPFPKIEGDDVVSLASMAGYLQRDEILSLSEVTPWLRLIEGDTELLQKFELGENSGLRIEGHTTGASFAKLNALVAAGLTSCHEAITSEEARERLRLGLSVMLRHGSIRSDLEALVELIADTGGSASHRIMFTPDWKSPADILADGYMDHLIRLAIQKGVAPIQAIQMATLNPAVYLGLDRKVGGLAPGRRADILLVDDLAEPTPRVVIADGQPVAENGAIRFGPPPLPPSATRISWLPHRVIPAGIKAEDFMVRANPQTDQVTLPAIDIVDKTITRRVDVTLPVSAGRVLLPEGRDVLKVSLRRRDKSGYVTAFLTGFGARIGGLATSVAHELHQPIVIGCREEDMAIALRHLKKIGGGIVLVEDKKVRAQICLPIGGLMSAEPLPVLADQMRSLKNMLAAKGCPLQDPVFTVGFLAFSVLPWIRLTPGGLLDVKRFEIMNP
ncbi:MAG: adenine deaminase C-terminal domain-containing protein [Thermodesulfobacteriota bacterium]